MTLDELLAAMNDAKAKALAEPKSAELKAAADLAAKAYSDAKAIEDAKSDDDPAAEVDESKLDAKTQAYIKKLRAESANHRVKAKDLTSKLKDEVERKRAILKAAGIESEDEKPEEKLKSLQTESQTLAFRNAILEAAVDNGVPKNQLKYFQFLVAEKLGELEEGDELSEEDLATIAKSVKGQPGAGNTSVGNGKGNNPVPTEGDGKITLDKFVRMSMMEKSELYTKQPALYNELYAEAKVKKQLVR